MWSERLQGLLLLLLGCAAMASIVLAQRAGWFQPVRLPLPASAHPELVLDPRVVPCESTGIAGARRDAQRAP